MNPDSTIIKQIVIIMTPLMKDNCPDDNGCCGLFIYRKTFNINHELEKPFTIPRIYFKTTKGYMFSQPFRLNGTIIKEGR